MAEVIRMPLLSDTMTEGVIAEWLKKEGDTVKSGDILAEIETDKATMELENYAEGTLLHIAAKKGDTIPVNGVLAVVGAPGEDFKPALDGAGNGEGANTIASQKSTNDAQQAVPAGEDQQVAAATGSGNVSQRSSDGGAKTEEITKSAAPVPATAEPVGNAVAIKMPKMSDTMTEGTIVAWLKKVGDKVKAGDILAEVETDKATMELENFDDGTLLYIGPKDGDSVAVDDVIAIVGEEGANFQPLLSGGAPAPTASPEPAALQTGQAPASNGQAPAPEAPAAEGDGAADSDRVKASPLAKQIAKDKGIDLKAVQGSGENGRIVKRDIDNFTPSEKAAQPAAPAPEATPAPTAKPADKAPAQLPKVYGEESFEEVAVSQMRKVIARRLGESLFTAPHFFVTMEITMDKAIAARTSMNEVAPVKLSFNDLVIKAAAVSLQSHPAINASWLGDKIRYNHHIHLGMAVAVEEGLLVPVIRFANLKSLSAISMEAKELGGKAKNKKLQPAEMQGNTFTISNLGMFGVDEFTAIINPPDACILAVGGIKETVKVENGEIKPTSVMKVTLSSDHRVVDGAKAAAFLQTLKGLLEDPIRLLI